MDTSFSVCLSSSFRCSFSFATCRSVAVFAFHATRVKFVCIALQVRRTHTASSQVRAGSSSAMRNDSQNQESFRTYSAGGYVQCMYKYFAYTRMHARTHALIWVSIHPSAHTMRFIHINIHIHIYIYISYIHTYIHIHTRARAHTHTYVERNGR